MGRGRQNWRAFRPVMRLHENHYTKRAGVAGIRARASHDKALNKRLNRYVRIVWNHALLS